MAPSTVTGWRFVENDLHDIASRVMEYDQEARLVRDDESGQLGLTRWVKSNMLCAGGYWHAPRPLHDLKTDRAICGEPDARVVQCMRAYDSWGRDMRDWHRRSQNTFWMSEKHDYDAMHEENSQIAEKFVHALKKDVSARPKAFIPRGI